MEPVTKSQQGFDNIGLVQDQFNFVLFPLGPVPERPNSVNPGLKFCFVFVFYILMQCLGWHFVLSLPFLVVKDQQYFVTSSCMFLDEKNVLEFCLILAWVKLNHLSRNRALNFMLGMERFWGNIKHLLGLCNTSKWSCFKDNVPCRNMEACNVYRWSVVWPTIGLK